MAKNDRILVDGIIDDRISIKLPSDKRDEAFEYFSLEQILKEYDLSQEELQFGLIDGGRDGGVDGLFVFVNGILLQDTDSFVWPRISSDLRLIIVTCKHHETFKQNVLDSLVATVAEVTDLSIRESELRGAYSDELLKVRRRIEYAYRKLSPRMSSFSVSVYYASRGDTAVLGEEVVARGKQVCAVIDSNFGSQSTAFTFIGSRELVELHRKRKSYTLELPFVASLSKGERYVVLVKLLDYFRFISDGGRLRRYLFDSNVRDFMGLNKVNADIRETLNSSGQSDFWWLNNGVTILATSAAITGNSLQVEGVQIVNGLQTTESIYRHYSHGGSESDERCVLIKVLVTNENDVRDAIILATNNQTDVEQASLRATDKIQRDIEDVMLSSGLYYERRKNHYANLGHPPADIITPLYAAASCIALVLRAPHRATRLRSRFMRNPYSYDAVFSYSHPIELWPKMAILFKRTDACLEKLRPKKGITERFLNSWRYIIMFSMLSRQSGTFAFKCEDILKFDQELISVDSVRMIWKDLRNIGKGESLPSVWTSIVNVRAACKLLSEKYGISNHESYGRSEGLRLFESFPPPRRPVSADLVEKIRAVMPPQPWKPGIHREVSKVVGCEVSDYYAAIEKLISEGHFLTQKNGVLYDAQGKVVGIDVERVDPETLELISAS